MQAGVTEKFRKLPIHHVVCSKETDNISHKMPDTSTGTTSC